MKYEKENLEYCSKCLFTASENIRECLDTLDIYFDSPYLTHAQLEKLSEWQNRIEGFAQMLQKEARK